VLVNETRVTVVGNLVADPVLRVTPGEREVAGFRLASTVRRYDATLGRPVDVRTSFYSVSCWGYLARNAAESLRKGERVVVTGRLDVREYAGDDKVLRTSVDVVADAVGHDLTYGTSRFTKVRRGVAGAVPQGADGLPADEGDELADLPEGEAPFGPAESDPFVPADGMQVGRDGGIEAAPSPI
jgi:single-strand DNA-binding protein